MMATLPTTRPRLHPSLLLRPPAVAHIRRRIATSFLAVIGRVSFLRRLFRFLLKNFLSCSSCKTPSYRRLSRSSSSSLLRQPPADADVVSHDTLVVVPVPAAGNDRVELDTESDKVVLKVSLLGDCQIGKTSFMIKYVGESGESRCSQMAGLNLMDKILLVKGAKIAFNIWDVGGDYQHIDQVGLACKDAAAILIMFDLTNRCTLNSVVGWYRQARRWNKTAIPILIGTKFDDFVNLPIDVQWTVVLQARTYAHAMKATLFFSSATHNINVNKIFKFITARCFDLSWNIERNLTIGEPIIDF